MLIEVILCVAVGVLACGYLVALRNNLRLVQEIFRLSSLVATLRLTTAESTPPLASAVAVREMARGWNLHPQGPKEPQPPEEPESEGVSIVGSL